MRHCRPPDKFALFNWAQWRLWSGPSGSFRPKLDDRRTEMRASKPTFVRAAITLSAPYPAFIVCGMALFGTAGTNVLLTSDLRARTRGKGEQ